MHAFISHSSQDAAFAQNLTRLLEAQQIKCWIAPRDIPAGHDYASAIIEAIIKSQCIALIFSSHANASPHVLREVERAITYRRPIVPMRKDQTMPTGSFDYLLATLQWAPGSGLSDDEALKEFAQAVYKNLSEPSKSSMAATPPPPEKRPPADGKVAHERLWSIARDMELGYRRACREKASSDEWTAVDARQIVLNEFLIRNSLHFSRELQTAAQAYGKSVARLSKLLRDAPDSELAEDWASTTAISADETKAMDDFCEASRGYEVANGRFELEFRKSSSAARPGFLGRLFGRG